MQQFRTAILPAHATQVIENESFEGERWPWEVFLYFAFCSPYSNFAARSWIESIVYFPSRSNIFKHLVYFLEMVELFEARATEKGQIVIPAELRKRFGI